MPLACRRNSAPSRIGRPDDARLAASPVLRSKDFSMSIPRELLLRFPIVPLLLDPQDITHPISNNAPIKSDRSQYPCALTPFQSLDRDFPPSRKLQPGQKFIVHDFQLYNIMLFSYIKIRQSIPSSQAPVDAISERLRLSLCAAAYSCTLFAI